MGRGIFFGILWGCVFSALLLSGMSLMIPPPGAPLSGPPPKARPAPASTAELPPSETPPEVQPETLPESTLAEAAPEPEPEPVPQAVPETAPASGVAPEQVPEPAPETAPSVVAAAPEAAPEPTAAVTPEPELVPQAAPQAAPTPETLAAAQPETAPAPVAVAEAAAPSVAAPLATTESAVPVAPEVAAPAAAVAPESAVQPTTSEALSDVAAAAPAAAAIEPATAATVEAAAVEPAAVAAPAPQPEAPAATPTPSAEAQEGQVTTAQPPQPGFVDVAGVKVNQLPRITDGEEAPAGTEEAVAGETPAVPGVRVNRLPSIGDGDAATDAPEAEAAGSPEALTAFDRNAASFENPEGRPLIGIVLIDAGPGAGGLDPAALAGLPFPVTLALDPFRSDAAEAAKAYRAAGFEVAILATGIPAGAQPKDVEVTFQSHLAALPQALAVIDLPEAAFQNDRRLSEQVVAILGAAGLGLITYHRGLNAADQLAAAASLPHAEALRVLDGEGEDADAIRRTLDRAAFEAGRTGAALLVGHSYPDTITTLAAWALGTGRSVALAPASAVVRAGPGG